MEGSRRNNTSTKSFYHVLFGFQMALRIDSYKFPYTNIIYAYIYICIYMHIRTCYIQIH